MKNYFPAAWPLHVLFGLITLVPAMAFAHSITFTTDYTDPSAGPGTILDQSGVSPSRVFQYKESDIYATAIRTSDPESHFHLFGDGIVIAGDSEGVVFTFGGTDPMTSPAFDVFGLEVLELGDVDTLLTPFKGNAAGTPLQVSGTGPLTFSGDAWHGVSHFIASFGTRIAGATARLVFTNLSVHQAHANAVALPGVLALLGLGLVSFVGTRVGRGRSRAASRLRAMASPAV